jgi:hypothetical protein
MFAGFTQKLNFGMISATLSIPSAFPTMPIGQLGNYNTFAANFIAVAGITESNQQAAINQLSYDLVSTGLMDRMMAVYPFVGGNATSHSFNLKDPRDADSAYRLTFSGGFTHSSSGVQGNGTNAFANTYINASGRFGNAAPLHASVYSTTTPVPAGTWVEFGVTTGVTILQLRIALSNLIGGSTPVLTYTTTTNGGGHWLVTKRNNADREIYRNGISEASSAVSQTAAYPNGNLYFFARLLTTSGNPDFYSTKNLAFCSVGDSLTSAQVATFYTIVQNFQTRLGRQV